ncbi:ligase-associated DNA damage response endonuclease PdeM [Pedobacter aquae]|uniref:Ligase-associated DNA damage response endonuclease PdeM n=1 Tax=Pedobacter aquae TaxID=2605747 RepID=A0A5C0VIS8_9SPHI|nr:ligase-associated DNA damage response endonuclease PdeM [Pedobacter aquae]QEK52605.1 ligase-associated DNA damage response endonuclease PdeM [Pedobacter aquae]
MLNQLYQVKIAEEDLILLPEKAVLFPQYKTLLLADVHLGKGGHFRKSGIPIPKQLAQEDLATLSDLIDKHQPETIIFLGDLFHSDFNQDWEWFRLWRELHQHLKLILVKGNHDILPDSLYQELNIKVIHEYKLGSLLLLHDLPKEKPNNFILYGHLHPGITISGKGKQKISLPCFYFRESSGILPAFGKFTGKYTLKNTEDAEIFAVGGSKIFKV